jgi:hypothetical protein
MRWLANYNRVSGPAQYLANLQRKLIRQEGDSGSGEGFAENCSSCFPRQIYTGTTHGKARQVGLTLGPTA